MPFFFDRSHFTEIRLLLIAGDVQADLRKAHEAFVIEVAAEGERTIIWGNQGKHGQAAPWAFSIMEPDGTMSAGVSDIPYDAAPEIVAELIATFDYDEAIAEYQRAMAEEREKAEAAT